MKALYLHYHDTNLKKDEESFIRGVSEVVEWLGVCVWVCVCVHVCAWHVCVCVHVHEVCALKYALICCGAP